MIKHFLKSVIVLTVLVPCYSCGQSKQADVVSLERQLYAAIARELVSVGLEDQKYRSKLDEVVRKYGAESKELRELSDAMDKADSINLIKVASVIDSYGWLGPEEIGAEANRTLFMVIQHSPLKAQEKYLPVLRQAVKDGKAKAGNLALLEDRMALKNGRKQIFGSQVAWNMKTNEYWVLPLEDPDNVDKRRAEVGLVPLADYLMDCCTLVWDLEAYKKDSSNQHEGNKN